MRFLGYACEVAIPHPANFNRRQIKRGMIVKPDRSFIAENGAKIEEFYWNGRWVVYIDNRLVNMTFNALIDLFG